jgi:hypothetical protein
MYEPGSEGVLWWSDYKDELRRRPAAGLLTGETPLGTYLGWNVVRSGFFKGHNAGFVGGYIPFARTQAERTEAGDPRLSLEERYRDHAGYVAAVKAAAERQVEQRFLLLDDATRLVREAEASDVLRGGGNE